MWIGVEWEVIDRNPVQKRCLPAEVSREPRYLPTGQVRAVAECASLPGRPGFYAPMVWLMATTGVQVGEAAALDVGDVVERRVGARQIWRARVRRSKSGVARDVPAPGIVVGMLDLGRAAGEPVFVGPAGGRLSVRNWRFGVWHPAVEAVGLEGLVPHEWRLTTASWAIADGADVKAVQRMLGHKSAKMTLDLYGHLWDKGLDLVSDRMAARLGG